MTKTENKKKCSNFPKFIKGVTCSIAMMMMAEGVSAKSLSNIEEALQNPLRPSADMKLDALRKPDQVLEFFGIEKGMHVLDVFAGPGYYSEILNHLVGKKGSVTMFNHAPWEAYSKEASDARVAGGRLLHTSTKYEDINSVEFRKNQYDAALIILGLHDLFHKSEKSTSGEDLNAEHFLQALYEGVEPGGVVGVIEHEADPNGDPYKIADDTERLSSVHVVKMMTEAGFVLEAQSSILRNNFDDYTKSVFDPSVRRRTDRAVLRFRKPR